MKTNRILLVSGLLAAFTAAGHTLLGSAEIHRPLLDSGLPERMRLLLYATYHLVTVTLLLSAAVLIWSARPANKAAAGPLPVFVSVLWLLFGLVYIVVSLLFSGLPALLMLPQWIFLISVGVLGLVGSRRQTDS